MDIDLILRRNKSSYNSPSKTDSALSFGFRSNIKDNLNKKTLSGKNSSNCDASLAKVKNEFRMKVQA